VGHLLAQDKQHFFTCHASLVIMPIIVHQMETKYKIMWYTFQRATSLHRDDPAKSARKVFYLKFDFMSLTHLQPCKLQAKAYG